MKNRVLAVCTTCDWSGFRPIAESCPSCKRGATTMARTMRDILLAFGAEVQALLPAAVIERRYEPVGDRVTYRLGDRWAEVSGVMLRENEPPGINSQRIEWMIDRVFEMLRGPLPPPIDPAELAA